MSLSRFTVCAILLAAFGSTFLSAASASILSTALRPDLNTLNDVDRERLALGIGDGDTEIEVGDILESVLVFDNLSNSAFGSTDLEDIASLGATYQLTAYSRLEVASIIPDDGDADTFPTFVFKGGFGDDVTMVKIYEDSVQDVNFTTDAAGTAITDATDGTLLLTLGLGELGDFWIAEGPADLSTLGAIGSGAAAQFFLGVSVLTNPAGDIDIVPDGLFSAVSGLDHDVVGFGDIFKITGPVNDWQAASNTTVSFVITPEPTALLVWMGISACVGFSYTNRRSRA
jgi:hypothetical protein